MEKSKLGTELPKTQISQMSNLRRTEMASEKVQELLMPLNFAIERELACRRQILEQQLPESAAGAGNYWAPFSTQPCSGATADSKTLDSILGEKARWRRRLRDSAAALCSGAKCDAMPVDVAVRREIVWRRLVGKARGGLRLRPLRGDSGSGPGCPDSVLGPPVFTPVEGEIASGECSISEVCVSPYLMDGHGQAEFDDGDAGHLRSVKCFGSREELIEHVRNVAMKLGYLICIKKSRKERTVILGCNRGGVYRDHKKASEGKSKRKRRSILTNCPFKIVGRKMKDGWWALKIINERHNHEPSKEFIPAPPMVRFSEEEILLIREMSLVGAKARQMLNALKQSNPKLRATLRDVYSIRAHIRQKEVSDERLQETADDGLRSSEVEIEKEVYSSCESKEILNQLYTPLLVIDISCQEEPIEHEKMLQSSIKCFRSREELLEHVRNISMSLGYVICIKKSHRDRNVTIGCDRGGAYRSSRKITDADRKRKSYSRLINCPFKVVGRKNSDGLWTMNVVNGEHNHEASKDMSIHPIARRCTEEEILQIKEMTFAGMQPREMLAVLRQNNPKLKVKLRDIYNVKSKIRREYLSGRSPIQALIDELTQGGFQCNMKYDDGGNLTHLFFAHPYTVVLSKVFANIFIINSTYKTNKYEMPLVDILGVTCFNTCFHSCFAFLRKEEEEDYAWVLNMLDFMLGGDNSEKVILVVGDVILIRAIQSAFPTASILLCTRHIERNILLNCKPHFNIGDNWEGFVSAWTTLINSPTEGAYYKAWDAFHEEFKEKVDALNYISHNYLSFKEYFVKAWTDKYCHFGYRISSGADDAHSTFKKNLQDSPIDAHSVGSKLCSSLKNQVKEVKAQILVERVRFSPKLRIPFFKKLVGHVSVFALRELLQQYKLAMEDANISACANQFVINMGLPCAHKIKSRMDESKGLCLSDIHSQWRIDFEDLDNIVLDITNQEGVANEVFDDFQDKEDEENRVVSSSNLSFSASVQLPIEYSLSENWKMVNVVGRDSMVSDAMTKSRKCSICKDVGHNSQTCQQKVVSSMSRSDVPLFTINGASILDMQDLNTLPDLHGTGGIIKW